MKNKNVLALAVFAGMAAMLFASTALAYEPYDPYNTAYTPSVEVNLDVLDELDRLAPQNIAPEAGVDVQALAPITHENIFAPEPAPAEEMPAPARVLKPAAQPLPPIVQTVPVAPVPAVPPFMPVATVTPAPVPAPVPAFIPPPVATKAAAAPKPAAVPALDDLTLAFRSGAGDVEDPALQRKLLDIVDQMQDLTATRLQVRAYAADPDGNTANARRMSLSRALAVRRFLMDNGIPPTRVDVRALGSESDAGAQDKVDLIFVR